MKPCHTDHHNSFDLFARRCLLGLPVPLSKFHLSVTCSKSGQASSS